MTEPLTPDSLPLEDSVNSAQPTMEELHEQVVELMQNNQKALNEISQWNAAPDPVSVLGMRLEVLLGMLLSPRDRSMFELVYQQQMAEQLSQIAVEARRRALAAGVGSPNISKLLQPGGF
jgi:hypothetical protein